MIVLVQLAGKMVTLMVRIPNSPALLHRAVVRHAPKVTLAFTAQKHHVAGK